MTANKKTQSKSRKSRTQARLMLVQALYQMQLTDHDINELLSQCRARSEYAKIEKMYLIKGSFALILFNELGEISQTKILEEGKLDFIEVPAFTWHTYVMLSDEVIIYETMEGSYHIDTWKKMASWAPKENSLNASNYLEILKSKVRI